MAVLEVKNLRVWFDTHHGMVRAVDGVNFSVEEGETLGLVGESGSGKSVTNLAILGLIPSPGTVEARRISFDGTDLLTLSAAELRKVRGNRISMIFQDPMTSLNPLLTIGRQLTEVLEHHLGMSRREARKKSAEALGDVGIPNPETRLDQYPHELSGGMRQRVMIAMALLCDPKLLIADEPTTALDVTIQAQILELMQALQKRHGTAIVLITHDLGVVAGMADRINVMYAGKIVETATTRELFADPMHPYSVGLLKSVPSVLGDVSQALESIPGQPPDLAALPEGCSFASRCTHSQLQCEQRYPPLALQFDNRTGIDRNVACHRAVEIRDGGNDTSAENGDSA